MEDVRELSSQVKLELTWTPASGKEVKMEVRGVYCRSAGVSSPHMVSGQPWLCNCLHDCILDCGSCSCQNCGA